MNFLARILLFYTSYAARYFGNTSSPTFYVKINIEEEKTKRSVQSNQAISKIDYELTFIYSFKKSRKRLYNF